MFRQRSSPFLALPSRAGVCRTITDVGLDVVLIGGWLTDARGFDGELSYGILGAAALVASGWAQVTSGVPGTTVRETRPVWSWPLC